MIIITDTASDILESEAKELVYDLRKLGYEGASIIGEILPRRQHTIILG